MNYELLPPALRSIIEHELAAGNEILAAETGWSKMDAVYRMKMPLDADYAEELARAGDLRVYHSADPHNGPPEFGVVSGRYAVSAPAAP